MRAARVSVPDGAEGTAANVHIALTAVNSRARGGVRSHAAMIQVLPENPSKGSGELRTKAVPA